MDDPFLRGGEVLVGIRSNLNSCITPINPNSLIEYLQTTYNNHKFIIVRSNKYQVFV